MVLPKTDEFASRFPDEIRTLLATLRMGNLGSLAVAECDDLALQARLFDYFRRRLAADNIYLFSYEVGPKDTNLVRSLTELTDHPRFKNLELTGKYKSIAIFVYGLEKFNGEQRKQFVKLLNFLRDRFATILYPIVIWGTASFVSQLSRNAPDFWSWKGHFFRFPSDQPIDAKQQQSNTLTPLSPIGAYTRQIAQDPDFQIWKELYLPLKANRVDETVTPFPTRHTLTYDELRQLAPLFPTADTYGANQVIFERGHPGDECYVIVSGQVEVLVLDALGNDIVISRLGRGDFFGEIALIKRVPRTATVRTTKATKVVTLTHRSLSLLNHKAPAVLTIISDIAQQRLESRYKDPDAIVSPLRRFAMEGSSLIREAPIDVRELIATDSRTVILGEAGAGKTTVLRRLHLDTAEAAQHVIDTSTDPIVLPIFLKLSILTPDKTVEQLILEQFQIYRIEGLRTQNDIVKLLNGQPPDNTPLHSILFLLDGLNEMPSPDQTRPILNDFIRRYGQHRFILSCRAQDYSALQGFRTAMLNRLSGEDIEAYLVNYLRAEQGRKVAREIYSDPQLEDLAQTPLALYMLAQIARRSDEDLPKNRGVLFEVFTDNLLQRTDTSWQHILTPSGAQAPLSLRKNALARLGLAMQEDEAWTFPLDRWLRIIGEQIDAYRKSASAGERLEIETMTPLDVHNQIKDSGLVRWSESREWVEFAHHTYQEFFAALAQNEAGYNLEPHLNTEEARRRWQGTIVLLYGIAEDKPALYSRILGEENEYARIWLAAQCLANSGEEVAIALQRLERTLPMSQQFALLFSAGLACRQLGRYPEALSYLHLAAGEAPGSAEVQYELGSLYRKVEQYERAIQHLEEAIHLRSDFVDAYNQLGITYHDQSKYLEALTVFRATTQLEPANAHHFYNLGTTQKIIRDYEGARRSFETAVKLKADYTEAKTQLSLLEKALSTGVVRVLENIPI
ncbi:MAG: cyclic nucleotide-binding domain-containing protein, partial [Anaerolineae bacterium]|nr:cyclic nucleotide-binding domain-containing protein [Anaerolineae bacterium]